MNCVPRSTLQQETPNFFKECGRWKANYHLNGGMLLISLTPTPPAVCQTQGCGLTVEPIILGNWFGFESKLTLQPVFKVP